MAFQEVKLSAIDIKKYPNKPFTGYYLSSKEIETKFGDAMVHDFQKKDNGERVSIYGFTSFNSKIDVVRPGVLVKLTYQGTENVKTKYGMKDVHQCELLQDDSDIIDNTRIPVASSKVSEPVPVEDDLPF